ncbi:MAG: NADH-quinone oxidoreductase subunit L [Opitutia bacterium Tous-C10FEB]|nr:MAG: NADH-quinone oxidoreductase subunit L [Opitutae bacterium Tous-C10FEB]
MTFTANHLWLIPTLPLLAAGLGALAPSKDRRLAAGSAIVAMAISFVLACLALQSALQAPATHAVANFAWFDLGASPMRLGFLLDPLTAFMCVMVTFVGLLIFIFSLGYMQADANFKQFFCFLSLFAAAMLGVLVANSLLLLFICWELVGLASYLLIGFWFHKPSAAAAAKKAFITTRIGDLGLLLGLLWLYDATGSLLFYDGGQGVLENTALAALAGQTLGGGLALSTAIGLLIFCGAIGKSGQFPLHVWLPDAMEGPTPVSALIHAATMVAAGVFLVARVYPLMQIDAALAAVPVHALTVVAFIGAITALLGAFIACGQNDIKRVLAFSTVSQLGYMMLALGVGSWTAAIFHLLTHAFFKALLFLGAGSVIHAAHHEQDIRLLGGLRPKMKITFATFAIGMMALSGVPFLFSGFWSKEAILHAAHAWDVSHLPLYAGLAAVVLTAFYMTRLVAETFLGQPRSAAAEHAHENSAVMTIPLILLALGAIGLGFLGTPAWPWLQARLSGTELHSSLHHLMEGSGLMLLSIGLVGVGLGLGWWLYGRRLRTTAEARDPLVVTAPQVMAALANRLGFDELYAATVGRLNHFTATLAQGIDRWVLGGLVNFLAQLGVFSGTVNRQLDEDGLNGGFDQISASVRGSGQRYAQAQTGEAHGYLRVMAVAFIVLALVLVLGGAR